MLLKEICSFSKGLQVKRDLTSTDYDIPYLHYGDLYKKYNVNLKLNEEYNKIIKVNRDCYNIRYQIDNNNIVMNLTSENYDDLGKCVIIKNPKNTPFIAGMETHLIKIHSQLIIPEYLNYYFESSSFLQTIHQFITGMKVFRVKPDDILNIDITLPNLRYQQHIVDIIGSIDDKIENNNKLYDKIEEYLLLEYKKLNKKIPESIFKDNFDILNGYSFKSKDYCKTGEYKVITIKNIKIDGFTTNSCDYINFNDKYQKVKLNIGDILLTMTGDVGRVGIVDQENCLLNQRVLKVTGISKAYTYIFLKSNYTNISMISKGSVQQNLSVNDLYNLKVNNSKQQIKNFRKYDLLFDKMILLKIENIKLQKLKLDYLVKFF